MKIPDDSADTALPGEPPLSISLNHIAELGDVRLRRRRLVSIGGGAVAVAMIAVSSAVALQTGADGVAGGSIPGCSSVAPPTAKKLDPSDLPASAATAATDAANFVAFDPAQAPDAWTESLWRKLAAWGMTYRPDTKLGSLRFAVQMGEAGNPLTGTAGTDGRVLSAHGDGWLTVGLSGDGAPPPCTAGQLDRRVTYADGTVVDLKSEVFSAFESNGELIARFRKNHAVGYHPDGTKVLVMATNEVLRHDDDPTLSGTAPTFGVPLTLDQVLELAANPDFRRSGSTGQDAVAAFSAVTPEVTGMTVDQARAVLEKSGFTVTLRKLGTEPGGVVKEQIPSAGQLWVPGQTVIVTH